MNKKALSLGLLAAVVPLTFIAPQAHAISQVPCSTYDFTHVRGSSTWCFANAGRAELYLPSVYMIWGGNNAGSVRGTNESVWVFSKWSDRYLGGHYDLKVVRID